MNQSLALAAFTVSVALFAAAPVTAQQPRTRRPLPEGGRARGGQPPSSAPGSRDTVAQPSAAEQARLEEFLRDWETQSSKVRTLKAEFVRRRYDAVFGEMDESGKTKPKVARGTLVYETPDRGRFEVEGEDPEHWLCTGQEVYQFDKATKRVFVSTIPLEMQGKAITEGPLPFIFGMKADDATQRYDLRIASPLKDMRAHDICIEVIPRRAHDLANFSRAMVIVDTERFLPRAVLLEDPKPQAANAAHQSSQHSRTVYTFYDKNLRSTLRINVPVNPREFRPNTLGYSVVRNETDEDDSSRQ